MPPRFVVGLILLVAAAPIATLDLRGPLCDDFALRELVIQHGWLGAWQVHARDWGPFRPLGFATTLAIHCWLWGYPAVAQLILVALSAASVCLLYRFVLGLSDDPGVSAICAGLFAAWPACTDSVAWVPCGAELLPAVILVLLSLAAFSRGHFLRSLACFVLSLGFHDQHILAPILFAILSLRMPDWRRGFLWSAAFFAAAIAIGWVLAAMAPESRRPAGISGAAGRLGAVACEFWRTVFWQTAGQWVLGTGAAASVRAFAVEAPARFAAALLGTAAGACLLWSARPGSGGSRGSRTLIGLGLAIGLVSLVVVAVAGLTLQARYTLWSGLGLALVCGGLYASCVGRWRRAALVLAIGLIVAASLTRMGRLYDWAVRTQVLAEVLRGLPKDLPPGGLVIVEGVRGYGRGFERAWGLSAAYRLAGGPPGGRVSTLVWRQDDCWVANEPPDVIWPVEATTQFWRWAPAGHRLSAMRRP